MKCMNCGKEFTNYNEGSMMIGEKDISSFTKIVCPHCFQGHLVSKYYKLVEVEVVRCDEWGHVIEEDK